jgi:hypothetical protein
VKRSPRPLGVPAAIGFAIGLFASFAMGSRSSSGTYTLPSGNPVSTGQTITSTLWNNTHSDLATEVTNSLDRGGRGAMTAPLQVVAGTVTAPGLTFATETNSGLYRAATNDIRFGVAATNVQRWSTSGSTFPLACTVQGGATVTTTVTNGNGTSSTGNGTGNGVSGTGGATSGAGLYGTGGAPNGNGATLVGTGAGSGVNATGGAPGRWPLRAAQAARSASVPLVSAIRRASVDSAAPLRALRASLARAAPQTARASSGRGPAAEPAVNSPVARPRLVSTRRAEELRRAARSLPGPLPLPRRLRARSGPRTGTSAS